MTSWLNCFEKSNLSKLGWCTINKIVSVNEKDFQLLKV